MNNSFARALRPDTWDPDPVLWIARYGARPDYGGPVDVHQYSSSGQVTGIAGSVDLNWAYTKRHLHKGGDDMPLNEQDLHNVQVECYRAMSNVLADIGVANAHVRDRARNLRAPLGLERLDKIVELIGKQNDVSAEDVAATLREGLAADLVPVLREVLGEAQADEIADSVVDKLAQRLQSGTAS
jgi:hypothetical protein